LYSLAFRQRPGDSPMLHPADPNLTPT